MWVLIIDELRCRAVIVSGMSEMTDDIQSQSLALPPPFPTVSTTFDSFRLASKRVQLHKAACQRDM